MARTTKSLTKKGRAHRIVVSLSPEDEAKLKRIASMTKVSRAEVIRRWIRAWPS
jgi:hypothetical protein